MLHTLEMGQQRSIQKLFMFDKKINDLSYKQIDKNNLSAISKCEPFARI